MLRSTTDWTIDTFIAYKTFSSSLEYGITDFEYADKVALALFMGSYGEMQIMLNSDIWT